MRVMDKKTEVFERMPVRRAVCKQILPAIASQMIALIYGLADTYFVGLLNDPNQTAAITVATSAFVMLTAISNLFGVGGASLIGRYLGQKKHAEASQASSIAFWGGLASGVIFSTLFALLADPLLHLCGADESTYRYAYNYAKWTVIIGGPATIMNTLLANLVRAEGSAAIASIGVSMGGVINTILDPFFVLPQFLNMGAGGAGAATAISNLIATLFFLGYLYVKRGSTIITPNPLNLRHTRRHIGGMLAIGFPSAAQYALTVVAVSAHMNVVSHYGSEAVAALGIVKKLDQLPLFFSIGVANGLLPLLAYNHAAGNHKRRQNAFLFGSIVSCGFSVLCLVCYELLAPQLVSLFIDSALTRQYGAVFLRIMVLAMPLMSICYPMIIQFQAMGKARESLICSVLRKGVIDIPLLFLMDWLLPLYGCMMVQPVVDGISLAVAIMFYRRINRSLDSSAAQQG